MSSERSSFSILAAPIGPRYVRPRKLACSSSVRVVDGRNDGALDKRVDADPRLTPGLVTDKMRDALPAVDREKGSRAGVDLSLEP